MPISDERQETEYKAIERITARCPDPNCNSLTMNYSISVFGEDTAYPIVVKEERVYLFTSTEHILYLYWTCSSCGLNLKTPIVRLA